MLATAGDLVFSASVEGYFYALDATTGEPLWHIALGGPVHAQPMTYAVNGQQFVTMTIGNTVYTFGLDEQENAAGTAKGRAVDDGHQ